MVSKDIVTEIFRTNRDDLTPEEFFKSQVPLLEIIDELISLREKRHGEVKDVLNGLLGFDAKNIPLWQKTFHAGKNTVARLINRKFTPDILTVRDIQSAMKWRAEIQDQINQQLNNDVHITNRTLNN